jgi:hypothetical protein
VETELAAGMAVAGAAGAGRDHVAAVVAVVAGVADAAGRGLVVAGKDLVAAERDHSVAGRGLVPAETGSGPVGRVTIDTAHAFTMNSLN